MGSLREAWSEGKSFAATLPALWVRSCGCYENKKDGDGCGDRQVLSRSWISEMGGKLSRIQLAFTAWF